MGSKSKYPLHPWLVHFPIAFFVLSFVFDLLGFVPFGQGLARAGFYSMGLGVLASLLAAIPGFVDYSTIRNDHPAKKVATWHMALNLTMVAVFAVNLGLRFSSLDSATRVQWLPFGLSVAGLILMSISGYLGGVMVYDLGVGVGRHRHQGSFPEHTIAAAIPTTAGSEKIWVPLADATPFAEGQTLRAEVGGVVMVVAKVDGQFWAFQEFCTHRYGPLSEGSFEHAQVRCPWHGSCFDLRTGKVKEGPAKVDLKVFPVQVREGKICVDATSLQKAPAAPQPENQPARGSSRGATS
jgi:uncharacterized membrane protein/nitrite reductase/ring-hydroxylating ferredoxin subunit